MTSTPVTDYVATLPEPRRQAIEHVLSVVRARVAQLADHSVLTEGVSYAMPTLLYRGKALIAVIATKRHLAIYPFSGTVVAGVASALEGFSLSPGTIRFTETRAVPDDVLNTIVELRMREIDEPASRRR